MIYELIANFKHLFINLPWQEYEKPIKKAIKLASFMAYKIQKTIFFDRNEGSKDLIY